MPVTSPLRMCRHSAALTHSSWSQSTGLLVHLAALSSGIALDFHSSAPSVGYHPPLSPFPGRTPCIAGADHFRRIRWSGVSRHVYFPLLLVTCGRATIARAGLVAGRTLGRAGRRVGRNDGRTGPLASRPGVRADGLVGWYVDDWPAWGLQ